MVMATKWNSGPPPSVGWWPTRGIESDGRVVRRNDEIRWFDGKRWSVAVSPDELEMADEWAGLHTFFSRVEWTDRPASWPKRSRT